MKRIQHNQAPKTEVVPRTRSTHHAAPQPPSPPIGSRGTQHGQMRAKRFAPDRLPSCKHPASVGGGLTVDASGPAASELSSRYIPTLVVVWRRSSSFEGNSAGQQLQQPGIFHRWSSTLWGIRTQAAARESPSCGDWIFQWGSDFFLLRQE